MRSTLDQPRLDRLAPEGLSRTRRRVDFMGQARAGSVISQELVRYPNHGSPVAGNARSESESEQRHSRPRSLNDCTWRSSAHHGASGNSARAAPRARPSLRCVKKEPAARLGKGVDSRPRIFSTDCKRS